MAMLHTRSWWMAVALGLGPAALPHCGSTTPPPATVASATAVEPQGSASAGAQAAAVTAAEIDRTLGELWAREGVKGAPLVDDARFLRRLSIDLRGVIPSPQEVTEFVADTAPDKRQKAIGRMIDHPRFVEHWAGYWNRALMGRKVREQLVDKAEFHGWLRAKFEAKTPWDKLVYELLTAEGRNRAGDGGDEKVNGAVNWLIKYRDTPADLTGATSRVFLGVQIQCAQCHDHKTEKWKMDDFRGLTACFMQTRGEVIDREGKRKVINVHDVDKVGRLPPKRREMMAEYIEAKPAALDGTELSTPSRRKALATWITSPSNPWFARAIVNRMWGHLFGRGIVDPIDDFRDSNPPVAPDLLARLADDFKAHGHDLRALLSLLTSTEAYQRAPGPRSSDKPAEGRLWARFRMMPMGSDELFDSLVAATKIDALLSRNGNEENIEQIRQQARTQFASFFEVDEEDDDDDFDGTIPQALILLNGRAVSLGTSSIPGSALDEILEAPGDDASKIRALYLRTLSREPSADEVARWVAFVNEPREAVRSEPAPDTGKGQKGKKGQAARDPLAKLDKRKGGQGGAGPRAARKQAFEDVFWTLLNSSEFFFNH